MIISRLTADGDWTFGQGLANYATNSEGLAEDVSTRIKSFANDWFLDTDANIDWIGILSVKNNRTLILNNVERVVSETEGVIKVNNIDFVEDRSNQRTITLTINLTTIFDRDIFLTVDI